MKFRNLALALVATAGLIGAHAVNVGSAEAMMASAQGNTIYVGSANGGVWKTTDGGSNWNRLPAGQSFDSPDEESGVHLPAVQPVRCAGRNC